MSRFCMVVFIIMDYCAVGDERTVYRGNSERDRKLLSHVQCRNKFCVENME